MYNSTLVWFCLIFFFLVLEMGHPGLLYFLSFSCGALSSYIVSLYDPCISYQLTTFIVGTCVALLALHFLVKGKKDQLQTPSHRSNLDALIGRKIIVYQSSGDSFIWQAKVSGQIWLVKSVHDESLFEGQQVVIVDVQGCHLRVDSIK